MKAYSLDLRERVVRAVEGGVPYMVVARTFQVSAPTIRRYVTLQRQTGSLAPKPIPGRQFQIGRSDYAALKAQLQAHPDATLAEHCALWEKEQHQPVHISTMHRAIKRVGWTRKKRRS
jgi:transposase